MLVLLAYFRKEISRQQFLNRFLEQEVPQKILPSDRRKFLQVEALCKSSLNQRISDEAFDEQLLLCFRDRPCSDVFSPAFEQWNEMKCLISKLEQKEKCLPVHFDGIAWNGYLTGKITRREYVTLHLSWGTEEHLAHILAYGTDKESFAQKYAVEASVCMRLQKLCTAYRDALISSKDFDNCFLELAKEFCADILK